MEAEHEAWIHDPRLLVHNILVNADFNGEINISPFQKYDADDNHWYRNFMTSNWTWKQAVRVYVVYSLKLYLFTVNSRTLSPLIPIPVVRCLSLSSSEMTRLQFRSLLVTPNSGRLVYRLETFIIVNNVPIEMALFSSVFWQFPKGM